MKLSTILLKNMAIFEQTLPVSTLCHNQNRPFFRIAPNMTSQNHAKFCAKLAHGLNNSNAVFATLSCCHYDTVANYCLLVKEATWNQLSLCWIKYKWEKLDNVYAFVHLNSICHAHFCLISGVRPSLWQSKLFTCKKGLVRRFFPIISVVTLNR
jgi:hypothetical protein